jgi:hypothetical protein
VIENAQKIDYLGSMVPYQGSPSCKTATYWIAIQVITIIFGVIEALGFVLLKPMFMRLWRTIRKSPRDDQTKTENAWAAPSEYVLEASNLIASLGGELLAIILSVIVMQKSGVGVFVESRRHLEWFLFLIFAIRPRVAPFTGLLGFFQGWANVGLANIVIDGILSVIAGLYWTTHFFHYAWSGDFHPAAPNTSLKLLGIGSIMSAAPPFLWWLAAVLYGMKQLQSGPVTGLVVAIAIMIRVLLVVLILPFLAVLEVLVAIRVAFKRLGSKNKGPSVAPQRFHSVWQPLRVEASLFRQSYALLVFFSWAINVGNWMFYSIYLTLQGDLYCPSGSTAISVILIFVPVAVKLPLQALGAYVK